MKKKRALYDGQRVRLTMRFDAHALVGGGGRLYDNPSTRTVTVEGRWYATPPRVEVMDHVGRNTIYGVVPGDQVESLENVMRWWP